MDNNDSSNDCNDCCCGSCADERYISGCGSGCSGGMGMVTLSMEDGQQLQCKILRVFGVSKLAKLDYIALMPVDSNDVLIFRYIKGNDGNINIDNIKSDEEFDLVSDALTGLFEDDK